MVLAVSDGRIGGRWPSRSFLEENKMSTGQRSPLREDQIRLSPTAPRIDDVGLRDPLDCPRMAHGDGRWQFNWKTPESYAGTCRAMYIAFANGATSPIVKFSSKWPSVAFVRDHSSHITRRGGQVRLIRLGGHLSGAQCAERVPSHGSTPSYPLQP